MKKKTRKVGELLEKEAFDSPVKDIKWEGHEVEVQSEPLKDLGVGKPVVIRCFEYKANPEAFKHHIPTKQELVNSHSMEIRAMLWGDGLTIIDTIPPKVHISKNKNKFRIFVTCEGRHGMVLADKPKTIQQIAQNA